MTDLNIANFNYDPIALSMINSFWEQPQYSVPEVNQQSYYAPRYTPYTANHKLTEPTYHHYNTNHQAYDTTSQSYVSYHGYNNGYSYYPQYPIYYPVQPTTYYSEAQTSTKQQDSYSYSKVDSHSTSESFCSVESRPESQASSLDTTITVVDTAPVEVFSIQIADTNTTIDEKALQEVLEVIDITSPVRSQPVSTKPKVPRKIVPYKPPNTEDDSRKFTCIACDKFFINRPGLRKHFRTQVHKNIIAKKGIKDPVQDPTTWAIGEHTCFVCQRAFAKYTDMIDHVVTH